MAGVQQPLRSQPGNTSSDDRKPGFARRLNVLRLFGTIAGGVVGVVGTFVAFVIVAEGVVGDGCSASECSSLTGGRLLYLVAVLTVVPLLAALAGIPPVARFRAVSTPLYAMGGMVFVLAGAGLSFGGYFSHPVLAVLAVIGLGVWANIGHYKDQERPHALARNSSIWVLAAFGPVWVWMEQHPGFSNDVRTVLALLVVSVIGAALYSHFLLQRTTAERVRPSSRAAASNRS